MPYIDLSKEEQEYAYCTNPLSPTVVVVKYMCYVLLVVCVALLTIPPLVMSIGILMGIFPISRPMIENVIMLLVSLVWFGGWCAFLFSWFQRTLYIEKLRKEGSEAHNKKF